MSYIECPYCEANQSWKLVAEELKKDCEAKDKQIEELKRESIKNQQISDWISDLTQEVREAMEEINNLINSRKREAKNQIEEIMKNKELKRELIENQQISDKVSDLIKERDDIKQSSIPRQEVREKIEMIRANSGNIDIEMELLCKELDL